MFSNTIKIYSSLQFSPMKFNLLHVYALLSLGFVGTHALTPREYWNSVLPNTRMPQAIKDLLFTEAWDDGMKRVTTNTASKYIKLKRQLEPSYPFVASNGEVNDHPQSTLIQFLYGKSSDEVNDHPQSTLIPFINGKSSDEVNDHPQSTLIQFLYGKSSDEVNDHPQSTLIPFINGKSSDEVKDHPQSTLIQFLYGKSNDEVNDHPQSTLIPFIDGKSSDEVNDHPQSTLIQFLYGKSSDEVNDHPQSTLIPFINGKSSDEVNDEVNDHPQSTLIRFLYGKSSDEVKDHQQSISFTQPGLSNMASPAYLYFLENDLQQGKERKMQLHKEGQKTMFLPKDISDSIPFLSKDLPEIYNMFSIKPDSMEAETMKLTLFICNKYKGVEGEEKFCATSLESMIDLATTKLGKKVKALSAENAKDSTILQKYKIELIKKVSTDKAMVCHPQMYPYAVFYCHMIKGTRTYMVSLEGVNGTKVKAVAVCHADTSKWNPKHLVFQFLKVNPGTAPICHILSDDSVVWVPY